MEINEDSESSEDLDYKPPGSSGDEGSDGDDVDVDSDDDKSDSKEKGGGEDSSEEDSDKDTKKEKSTGKKAKMVTFSENKKVKKKDSKTDVRPPKRPMTGYAYFMRSEGHNFKGMDIKEVSALLSSKWKAMGEEERRPFIIKHEEDRKRYSLEMETFSKSQDGKMYQNMKAAKQKKNKNAQKSRSGKKSSADAVGGSIQTNGDAVASTQNVESSAPLDPLQIPIFTEQFIEFNRKRDHQLRQLRKAASEVESENNQILSHMRALNAMIGRNEQDAVRLMAHNEALTDQLEMIKRSAIERVKATSSYAQNETLTNFVEESSHSLEAGEFLSELSSFLSSEKVGLSEKIALKAALKKVEYPKDPELS
ncbi:high mobility group protein 20A-like [Symsagittifera roscoffensis]|uniref:high mobility group protein 20A-like n=1 Tax=Symsagittifera roscoffensis TaxID=84072 RepID=UPI00307B237B